MSETQIYGDTETDIRTSRGNIHKETHKHRNTNHTIGPVEDTTTMRHSDTVTHKHRPGPIGNMDTWSH